MMRVERLPNEDFPLLKDIEEGYVPDPEDSIAVVARDGKNIFGRMFLLGMAHIEGTWVAKRFRNGFLANKMIVKMEQEAKKKGLSTIFAYSPNDEVSGYMARLGYTLTDWKVFRKDL